MKDNTIDMGTGVDTLAFEVITNTLPADLQVLQVESLTEGFRHIERLASEWQTGIARFDQPGEALIAVRSQGVLAGIGGLTIDPVVPDALRMRRLYVRPLYRRAGVGSRLATELLAGVSTHRLITVNATPTSFAFWEAIGFAPDPHDGHTHSLVL